MPVGLELALTSSHGTRGWRFIDGNRKNKRLGMGMIAQAIERA
jgi:hypothetical protein